MLYEEWKFLRTRTAIEQGSNQRIDGSLLVGEEKVLGFLDNESRYGWDSVEIYPAFHKGERCWVETRTWMADTGYSAQGIEDTIIPFEKGVRILIEHDCFRTGPVTIVR